eukprot:1144163-Pelagomonas_calceolata.AAC.2
MWFARGTQHHSGFEIKHHWKANILSIPSIFLIYDNITNASARAFEGSKSVGNAAEGRNHLKFLHFPGPWQWSTIANYEFIPIGC